MTAQATVASIAGAADLFARGSDDTAILAIQPELR
jgi:hypothetical protein